RSSAKTSNEGSLLALPHAHSHPGALPNAYHPVTNHNWTRSAGAPPPPLSTDAACPPRTSGHSSYKEPPSHDRPKPRIESRLSPWTRQDRGHRPSRSVPALRPRRLRETAVPPPGTLSCHNWSMRSSSRH